MTAQATETEAERVLDNRLRRLLALDLSYPQAFELAVSPADLHQVEDMAEAGCPGELLLEILT